MTVPAVATRPGLPGGPGAGAAPGPDLQEAQGSGGLLDWGRLTEAVQAAEPRPCQGWVEQVVGLAVEARGPVSSLGELCWIDRPGRPPVPAEVVGFRGARTLLMPLGDARAIRPGSRVEATGQGFRVAVGEGLLGRVLDGLGRPLDGQGPVAAEAWYPAEADPPPPLARRPIREPLPVGVRAIDALLTCGRGQRVGIFAGSGVGKSTLLAMMTRHTAADVVVVALIGERNREVRDFVDHHLAGSRRRTVVVAATADRPALVRIKAAQVATAIAEFFRDRGRHVLLVMDSVTRYAMALREVGLAVGEPPATRGYPPSVFAALPRLLERAGTGDRGSITGFYTVLVDGDDFNEPVADAVRGTLDGHIVLSRQLAEEGQFPAVDVLASVSRLMPELVDAAHWAAAQRLRRWLGAYREARDLVEIGAYQRGTNPDVDRALERMPAIRAFLSQGRDEAASFSEAVARLQEVAGGEAAGEQRA
ncbi:FliI/YscN family ATPase [Thermaerobacter subterraneus]|uniref:Type III secretion system ATPase, FliI/YscN n=1 Tax=Thermaerobacter subterraneus DSM 13965 TaxID=867903 RepID=K6PY78_9FIRM|nr:FliI/YscN family ATPase [Thermaerobacter subterraneus]EKP93678.1 type III secretion system ATPase, FliI/YscN [Thermaerobacter subterraneus DSM 13965]